MPEDDKKIAVTVDADLEDLIPDYLENRQEDIKQLKADLEKDDFENTRIIGHSMKGSGGGYGFEKISGIGALIEQAAKNRNSEEIKKQIEELSDYLDRLKVVYTGLE